MIVIFLEISLGIFFVINVVFFIFMFVDKKKVKGIYGLCLKRMCLKIRGVI